jgi:hypothetical protein
MKRFFFPVWCKGSIGDSRSPDAGSSPAAGSIAPHGPTRHTPRIAVLTATFGLLAASLVFASASALAEPLPDGRVSEKVTPTENYDADAYVPLELPSDIVQNEGEFETRLPFQVAADGEALVYVAAPTVGGTGQAGLGLGNQYISRRLAGGGWGKPVNLIPLNEKGAGISNAYYQAFSPNLTLGILESGSFQVPSAPALSPEAPGEGYAVLYARSLMGEGKSYEPLFRSRPLNRTAGEFKSSGTPKIVLSSPTPLAFAGGSASFGRLLFEANGVFAGTEGWEGSATENNLYESAGGVLSLVNVLPGGGADGGASFGGGLDFSRVISEDGSRVFWTGDSGAGSGLFVSEGVGSGSERTVQVDASQAGGAGGGGKYWSASRDGSRVFFTDSNTAELTANTGPGSEESLYVYEVPTGHLTDLTPGVEGGVEGVLGEGEHSDNKYTVYFVAKSKLTVNVNVNGLEAVEGADNLYALKEGSPPVFVTTLSPEDGNGTNYFLGLTIRGLVGDWVGDLGNRTAEVTPDGGSVVFMSNDQGFNGHYEEAESRRLQEVYVYDSEAGEDGSLFCASCARDGLKAEANAVTQTTPLGAFLPVSTILSVQPGLISEDGSKVFFDANEPLVSGDTNGEIDVYEWERDGSGRCGESGGCVYVLSGGAVPTSSWLIGADTTGNNVFVVTRAQLSSDDTNEAYDVYDLRVGGVQPVLPPACSGTGCQGVPATAPTFATPSSVTFEGVGNFAPPPEATVPAKPRAKTKPLTKAQKLTKALAVCHAKHPGGARVACEAKARRRYRARSKKK